MSSSSIPPAKAICATEATILQLAYYWRQRQGPGENPFETASQSMLKSGDVHTSDTIPPYHSNFGVAHAITDFLGRDIHSFNKVRRQLQAMVEIWDFITEQKKSYDGLKWLPMLGNWQLMEDFLLCGRVISTRASIIPEPEVLSTRPFLTKSATSMDLMDIDSVVDHDPGLVTHQVQTTQKVEGVQGNVGSRGNRKRKFSEVELGDCPERPERRVTGRKQAKETS
ncbi:hypothetical protein LA080_011844 [Diaporthe eres]|nr:hypothetical protein LA080_011844 [Diaporthe eres]